jgi:hypothetical protein
VQFQTLEWRLPCGGPSSFSSDSGLRA